MIKKNHIHEIRKTKSILLFDGLCNLCDHSVQFVIKRDHKNVFIFSSLQSKSAIEFIGSMHDEIQNIDSIVLITKNKIYTKSTAALKIAAELNGLWILMSVFFIIPKPIRDWIYDGIAKRRYQWFGKFDSCKIPNPQEINKFID